MSKNNEQPKHTPEPWHNDGRSIYSTGICLVASTTNNSTSIPAEQDEANAARIVACVNAMEGIEDPLGFRDVALNNFSKLNQLVKNLTKQRDELLTTMKYINSSH